MPAPCFQETCAEIDSEMAGCLSQPSRGGAIEGLGRVPQRSGQQISLRHELGEQDQVRTLGLGSKGHLCSACKVFLHPAILACYLGSSEGQRIHKCLLSFDFGPLEMTMRYGRLVDYRRLRGLGVKLPSPDTSPTQRCGPGRPVRAWRRKRRTCPHSLGPGHFRRPLHGLFPGRTNRPIRRRSVRKSGFRSCFCP